MLSKAVRAGGWALALSGAVLSLHAAYLPVKAQVAQVMLTRAVEEGLASGEPIRPWSWADMEVVGRLSHPGLGEADIVLRGGIGQAMAFGPADLPTGSPSTRLISAHRDTHFRWLQHVEVGDRLTLETVGEEAATYQIVATDIRRWDAFAMPTNPATPLLALSTCYPFDAEQPGPLRFVVWARKVAA